MVSLSEKEFLRDYLHGNPEKFNSEDFNKRNKNFFGRLYPNTNERLCDLRDAGYHMYYIWEKDYRTLS